MSLRNCYGILAALALAGQWGCCGINWGPAGPPCARTWCGSQCGEVFWNEWFSIPPLCRDKCDCCGDFTCSNNPYVLNGPDHARFGPIYDDGGARGRASRVPQEEPSPAAPTREPRRGEPVEELPPLGPTTAVYSDEFGRMVSYEEPPIDSRPGSRKLGRPPARYAR